MDEILSSYIEDLRDSLLLFNESLLDLQNGVSDKDTVNNIFRVAHTIKGNSAAMGFIKIEKVMHVMEDLLSEVRNGKRKITPRMTDLLFACHDLLEDFLGVIQSTSSDESMEVEALSNDLINEKNNGNDPAPAAKKPVAAAAPGCSRSSAAWALRVSPAALGSTSAALLNASSACWRSSALDERSPRVCKARPRWRWVCAQK